MRYDTLRIVSGSLLADDIQNGLREALGNGEKIIHIHTEWQLVGNDLTPTIICLTAKPEKMEGKNDER